MITNEALRLEPTFRGLRAIGPWLADVLAPLDPDRVDARIAAIELAVHELAANSIEHALTDVAVDDRWLSVRAEVEPDRLAVTVIDGGTAFEPFTGAGPEPGGDADAPAIGGFGLMIIFGVASSVEYRRVDGDNRWRAVFAV